MERTGSRTVFVYGASDDLIEVDGDVRGCDEYPSDDAHFVFSNGVEAVRLRVWFTRRGLWAIAAAPVDEDTPMLPVRLEGAARGYSAKAQIDDVNLIVHEAPETR